MKLKSERIDPMKALNRLNIFILAGFFLMLVSFQNANAASQTTKKAVKQTKKSTAVLKKPVKKIHKKKFKKKVVKKPTPKGPGDPDLEARIISLTHRDDITIVNGRVKNVGGGDFISGVGQAAAWVKVVLPHLSGPDAEPIVYSVPITRLNSGSTMVIRGTIRVKDYYPDFLYWGPPHWDLGGCEARMNHRIVLCVSYDPDIHMDGNEQNDDGNHDNDSHRWNNQNQFRYTAECE